MLLSIAGMLTLAGFLMWILGAVFEYTEIATIGGALVVATGAMITTGGLQYPDGETASTTTVETTVAATDIGEATHVQTKDVSAQDGSPTGLDFNEDGSKLYISGAGTASIYSYDTGDHDLSLATFRNSFSVSTEDTTPVGVEFRPSGERMYVVGDDTDAIYQYDLGTSYNITTASLAGNLSVAGHVPDPRAADFNADGTVLYVVGSGDGTIHSYSLSTPYDVTTASHLKDFDVSSQEGTPTALDFSLDGTRMLIAGEGQDSVFGYELDTAYDLDTAAYTGNLLDVSAQANQPSALSYEDDGRKTFLADRQGGTLEQYDSSMIETDTETVKETTYANVPLPQRFPGGVLLMVVGGMLIARRWGDEGGVM